MVRGKTARLLARDADHADGDVVAHQRREQHAAVAAQARQIPDYGRDSRLRFSIGELHRLALSHHLIGRKVGARHRERRLQGIVRDAVGGCKRHKLQRLVDEAEHRGGEAAKQPVGARRNRLEHRLHIRRRAGDDLEDVSRCGLALQRLPRLVEQPGVFNGDQRLVAERFSDGNVSGAEGAGPPGSERQQANAFSFAQQGQKKRRIDAVFHVDAAFVLRQINLRPVGQVEHFFGKNRPGREVGLRVQGNRRTGEVFAKTVCVSQRHEMVGRSVTQHDRCHVTAEQPPRRRDDGVEHRLHIRRRLADDAQYVGGGGLPLQRQLRFFEQPGVLDGNEGLVSEGLRLSDLGRTKSICLFAAKYQNADTGITPQHRHIDR